ncbi:Orexin receptor type 1 [Armadillidium nasatum]|uniref:Orexin receptor type 1 n=1 Tax=Armadillidium nasatum TaxID=96803 RepID=A0A5N5TL56_9CRUS|nr:Orexin receptor type 1 [Armadillidium nasatum]
MKKRFVKMLFAMIIVFTLCWLPFQLFVIFNEHLVMNNDSKTNDSDEVYVIAFTLMEYIVYLNPAINPFIYGLMHENFKRGFRVTFKCFFKKKPNFVLVPSYGGSQPYVWNRRSRHRHTMPSSSTNGMTSHTNNNNNIQEANPKELLQQQQQQMKQQQQQQQGHKQQQQQAIQRQELRRSSSMNSSAKTA